MLTVSSSWVSTAFVSTSWLSRLLSAPAPGGVGRSPTLFLCCWPLAWRWEGQFVFFEVGSYKVHIYSRSVPYCNHWSAQPQFGEAESRSSPDAQLCTAVNRVQRKREINHLKQDSPQKIYNSSSVRCKGKIHIALHRHQTSLSFGTTFSQS